MEATARNNNNLTKNIIMFGGLAYQGMYRLLVYACAHNFCSTHGTLNIEIYETTADNNNNLTKNIIIFGGLAY